VIANLQLVEDVGPPPVRNVSIGSVVSQHCPTLSPNEVKDHPVQQGLPTAKKNARGKERLSRSHLPRHATQQVTVSGEKAMRGLAMSTR
jgi:hypothetical protein